MGLSSNPDSSLRNSVKSVSSSRKSNGTKSKRSHRSWGQNYTVSYWGLKIEETDRLTRSRTKSDQNFLMTDYSPTNGERARRRGKPFIRSPYDFDSEVDDETSNEGIDEMNIFHTEDANEGFEMDNSYDKETTSFVGGSAESVVTDFKILENTLLDSESNLNNPVTKTLIIDEIEVVENYNPTMKDLDQMLEYTIDPDKYLSDLGGEEIFCRKRTEDFILATSHSIMETSTQIDLTSENQHRLPFVGSQMENDLFKGQCEELLVNKRPSEIFNLEEKSKKAEELSDKLTEYFEKEPPNKEVLIMNGRDNYQGTSIEKITFQKNQLTSADGKIPNSLQISNTNCITKTIALSSQETIGQHFERKDQLRQNDCISNLESIWQQHISEDLTEKINLYSNKNSVKDTAAHKKFQELSRFRKLQQQTTSNSPNSQSIPQIYVPKASVDFTNTQTDTTTDELHGLKGFIAPVPQVTKTPVVQSNTSFTLEIFQTKKTESISKTIENENSPKTKQFPDKNYETLQKQCSPESFDTQTLWDIPAERFLTQYESPKSYPVSGGSTGPVFSPILINQFPDKNPFAYCPIIPKDIVPENSVKQIKPEIQGWKFNWETANCSKNLPDNQGNTRFATNTVSQTLQKQCFPESFDTQTLWDIPAERFLTQYEPPKSYLVSGGSTGPVFSPILTNRRNISKYPKISIQNVGKNALRPAEPQLMQVKEPDEPRYTINFTTTPPPRSSFNDPKTPEIVPSSQELNRLQNNTSIDVTLKSIEKPKRGRRKNAQVNWYHENLARKNQNEKKTDNERFVPHFGNQVNKKTDTPLNECLQHPIARSYQGVLLRKEVQEVQGKLYPQLHRQSEAISGPKVMKHLNRHESLLQTTNPHFQVSDSKQWPVPTIGTQDFLPKSTVIDCNNNAPIKNYSLVNGTNDPSAPRINYNTTQPELFQQHSSNYPSMPPHVAIPTDQELLPQFHCQFQANPDSIQQLHLDHQRSQSNQTFHSNNFQHQGMAQQHQNCSLYPHLSHLNRPAQYYQLPPPRLPCSQLAPPYLAHSQFPPPQLQPIQLSHPQLPTSQLRSSSFSVERSSTLKIQMNW